MAKRNHKPAAAPQTVAPAAPQHNPNTLQLAHARAALLLAPPAPAPAPVLPAPTSVAASKRWAAGAVVAKGAAVNPKGFWAASPASVITLAPGCNLAAGGVNPKKRGSAPVFALYRNGQTLAQFGAAFAAQLYGATPSAAQQATAYKAALAHVAWDFNHGYLVVNAPA